MIMPSYSVQGIIVITGDKECKCKLIHQGRERNPYFKKKKNKNKKLLSLLCNFVSLCIACKSHQQHTQCNLVQMLSIH